MQWTFLKMWNSSVKKNQSNSGQLILDIADKTINLKKIIFISKLHKISNLNYYYITFDTGVEITIDESSFSREKLLILWKAIT